MRTPPSCVVSEITVLTTPWSVEGPHDGAVSTALGALRLSPRARVVLTVIVVFSRQGVFIRVSIHCARSLGFA